MNRFNQAAPGRSRGRNDRQPHVAMLLLYELNRIIMPLPIKPVATMAIIAVNMVVHYVDSYTLGYNFSINKNCILPRKMLHLFVQTTNPGTSRKWLNLFSETMTRATNGILEFNFAQQFPFNRLILSSIIHVDDWHLYYNMVSLAWKGVHLENSMGMYAYIGLLIYGLIVSHILMIFLSCFFFYSYMWQWHPFESLAESYDSCAVGFSAVLFCLKYVLNANSGSISNVYGFALPSKLAAWLEIVIISVMQPNSSFVGHLAGILAGFIWVHGEYMFMEVVKFMYSVLGFSTNRYTYAFGRASSSSSYGNTNSNSNSSSGRTRYADSHGTVYEEVDEDDSPTIPINERELRRRRAQFYR